MVGDLIATLESSPLGQTYNMSSVGAVSGRFASVFAANKVIVDNPDQTLDAYVSHSDVDEAVSLVYQRFGSRVGFKPLKDSDFFILNIPIRGSALIGFYDQKIVCNHKQGVMLSAETNMFGLCYPGFESLVVKVRRAPMERLLEQRLGKNLSNPLKFSISVPLDSIKGNEIVSLLSFITASLANGAGISSSKVIRENLESLLMNCLLTSLKHNYSPDSLNSIQRVIPKSVLKAKQIIEDNLQNHFDPEDLASRVCVSTRTLQSGFREHLSTTPMRYLKDLRLTRIHEKLLNAQPSEVSISTVAYSYGMTHMGHFGVDYKKKFGETPTDTLNRSTADNDSTPCDHKTVLSISNQ